jgi:antitoxin component YwqK of YwqJK toxin-antitoxin module
MYLKTGKKILQSSTDKNIKKHVGEYTHWHKNGEVWDAITYNSEGVPEGKRLTYNEQGNIIFTADYNNGEICNQSGIEQKISYGVAQLSIIPPIEKTTTWVNGVKHGAETTYTYDDDFSAERVLVETSICEYKDGVVVNEKVEE